MLIDHETYVPGSGSRVDEPLLRKLKVSEALRIGAALRPQCRGHLFINGMSCALGAIWEGFGFAPETVIYAPPEFEIVSALKVRHLWPDGLLAYDIVVKNDTGQTREAIADWLETKGL